MSLSYTTGNPNNLTGGATASMNDIQGPFTDIKTFLTDGSGTVGDTILTSANNAVWRTVFDFQGNVGANALSTTAQYFNSSGSGVTVGGSVAGIQGMWLPAGSSDVAVTGKTARFRARIVWLPNATAPGVTMNWGLYPVTGTGGGAGSVSATVGTVLAGSTVSVSSATIIAAVGQQASAGFDYSALAASTMYVPAVVATSGTQAGLSIVGFQFILEMRHT